MLSTKAKKDPWQIASRDMSKEGLERSFRRCLQYGLAKDRFTTTPHDDYLAIALAIRDRIVERWIRTQQSYHRHNVKRIYYLSLEFLIGRLLGNNVLNLGLWDETKKALSEYGLDLSKVREEEPDAGLGNGGLGRLAACFLDSMASLGIPAHGYGIRYDYGIFNQKIVNGYQVESPDHWLQWENPWEFARPEYTVTVRFYGNTVAYVDKYGRPRTRWENTQNIAALPYDIPITGFKNDVVNTLRLWSARSSEEFDLEYFNNGDYENAVYNKMYSENISRVLYPNDSTAVGRELRLKQEYFFTAAAISDIIRRFKTENSNFTLFPYKAAIQLNDTHPVLAVVEFMRLLLDEEGLGWETAWDITTRSFAYTNHTVMPEALECWGVTMFEKLLPRHMQIIYEINARFLREIANRYPGDNERLRRMSLVEESEPKRVRMAYLAVVACHSVNGVSKLHTGILKSDLFRDFCEFYPKKFNNKTNGISQRRWLLKANRELSALITEAIGDKWVTNLYELEKLARFKDDVSFQRKWRQAKRENKRTLSAFIQNTAGIAVNEKSIFDVQIKRIHEYKRQLLFAFYVVSEYLRLKEEPGTFRVPRTFLFGGKAAPGYTMAKLIIKFINSIAGVIDADKTIKGLLKVVFLENYRVSLAEKIFPASDLSEQISTAGTEASGTGCMKFMMNGALTVGTWDGANIEIAEAVGKENIYTFGLKADEIRELKNGGYRPEDFINLSPRFAEIFRLLDCDFFSPQEPGIFKPIAESLRTVDPFFVCADFDSYCTIQEKISADYEDEAGWTEKSILNVSRSGRFSSDRTISEYAKDIWKIPFEKSR